MNIYNIFNIIIDRTCCDLWYNHDTLPPHNKKDQSLLFHRKKENQAMNRSGYIDIPLPWISISWFTNLIPKQNIPNLSVFASESIHNLCNFPVSPQGI